MWDSPPPTLPLNQKKKKERKKKEKKKRKEKERKKKKLNFDNISGLKISQRQKAKIPDTNLFPCKLTVLHKNTCKM